MLNSLFFVGIAAPKPVTYAGANMGIRITFAFFANVLQSFAFARELLIGVLVDILLRILTLSNSGKGFAHKQANGER